MTPFLSPKTSFRDQILIGSILVAAIVLRFHHVDYGFVTWQDTGFIAGFAKAMSLAGLWDVGFLSLRYYDVHTGTYTYYVNHPPLTHILVAVLFDIFGPREWAYRSFNLVVGGILGGVFLYRLANEKLGREVAIGALMFWAIAPSTAYFERMFSMSMEALTFMIILTFYFFREDGSPGGWNRIWLFVAAVLGPLFDWHFSFIYVPLFIYCLFDRRRFPVLIGAGMATGAVTVAYMVYSAGVVAGATSVSEFLDATLIRWKSYIVGKVELDKSVFDIVRYLKIIFVRFELHFTKLGVGLVAIWAAVVAFRARRGTMTRWELVIPAILLGPGVIYFVLVPHNTRGHMWTLYFLWPVVAVMFGTVFGAALKLRPRSLGVGLAAGLAAVLVGWSLPIFSALHGLSPYHLANTRTGQVLDIQRDKIRFYAVENQDTFMFYTNVIPSEINGRRNIGRWLAAREKRKLPLPDAIIFNQGYRPMIFPESADRLARLDEDYGRQMARYGYRATLLRPAPVWTRKPFDDMFLVMDQYKVPAGIAAGRSDQPRLATFMSGGRVLRGIYQAHGGPGHIETKFHDFSVPAGVDALRMTLLLMGGAKGLRYEVELAAADGTRVTRSGSLNNGGFRRLDIPARRFRGKVATLTVRSELREGLAGAYFYVAEPRLQSTNLDPENTFVVNPDADIYRDEKFISPRNSVGFDAVKEFWRGVVWRDLKRQWNKFF